MELEKIDIDWISAEKVFSETKTMLDMKPFYTAEYLDTAFFVTNYMLTGPSYSKRQACNYECENCLFGQEKYANWTCDEARKLHEKEIMPWSY